LLVALIALIAIPSVGMLGRTVSNSFDTSKNEIAGASAFPCEPGSPIHPECLD